MEYTVARDVSQCTYRCVVLPDTTTFGASWRGSLSQCTYRCVVLPDPRRSVRSSSFVCLNAPTGAWCSLTGRSSVRLPVFVSQCTYRCVVLPDGKFLCKTTRLCVSMHLQVRGAP